MASVQLLEGAQLLAGALGVAQLSPPGPGMGYRTETAACLPGRAGFLTVFSWVMLSEFLCL
jgi:hypothetical protein